MLVYALQPCHRGYDSNLRPVLESRHRNPKSPLKHRNRLPMEFRINALTKIVTRRRIYSGPLAKSLPS